jgi:hypothetical protein
MEYNHDVNIDESALDVEFLEQPTLMKKYGDIVSEARKELDYLKEQLDAVKAQLSKEIRADPDSFDVGKITENIVADTILLQDEYKKAAEEVVEAQYRYGMARSALDAISTRKDTLEGLIKLYGMQYFTGPSVPRNLTEERMLRNEKINKAVASKIVKKKGRKS